MITTHPKVMMLAQFAIASFNGRMAKHTPFDADSDTAARLAWHDAQALYNQMPSDVREQFAQDCIAFELLQQGLTEDMRAERAAASVQPGADLQDPRRDA